VFFTGAILQNASFVGSKMKTSPSGGGGVNFSCTQLGGADFSNAEVTQANFSDAVMLVKDSCCVDQSGYYCGIVAINQRGYGATVLPVLTNKVTCPNGELAICSGKQWVVPQWSTANCNPQHVTQRVWYKPNCGGEDTSGVIAFADSNLRTCVIDQLYGGDRTRKITRDVAEQAVSLSCPCRNISNTEGLQYFTALRVLDLSCNRLAEGTFLTSFTKLNNLKIGQNQLVMLNLQGVPNLNYLDASHNRLTAVLLDANTYISFLDLSYNNLTKFDADIQTRLNYLDLSHNKLSDVGDLSALTQANTIYLQNNSLAGIGNISGLINENTGSLLYMNLACNLSFNCSSLGLGPSVKDQDFKTHTQCGMNNLPGCVPQSQPATTYPNQPPSRNGQKNKQTRRK